MTELKAFVQALVEGACDKVAIYGEDRRLIEVGAQLILIGLTNSVTCHKEPESTNDQDDADWEALRAEAERIQSEQEREREGKKIQDALKDYEAEYQEAEKERRKRAALRRWNPQEPKDPITYSYSFGSYIDADGRSVHRKNGKWTFVVPAGRSAPGLFEGVDRS